MKEEETEDKQEEKIEEKLEETQAEEKTLEDEVKEFRNKYLHVLADQENIRKRMQKEKQDTVRFAIENTVSEFLPIVDNFENALNLAKQSSKEVQQWSAGFQMILSQFREVLHNHGIVAFHSEGNIFDPHFHEAMEIVETEEHPDGTILEEFSKGYKSGNRTIRPARVKVAKKPLKEEPSEQPIEAKEDELTEKEE